MKIALINGSPKVNNSASGVILEDLKYYISEKAEILDIDFHKSVVSEEQLKILNSAEAWVFAYPLYVDGIPSHLLSCLVQLEKARLQNHNIHIYGIVNCGFYEGIQAEFALKILQNWCIKAGFTWGGGIGIGGGGCLSMMPKTKYGQGPKAPIHKALELITDKIIRHETQENNYVSVAFPRFLYKMAAEMGWRQLIKYNGGKAKDLKKQWK
ncbi:MAG: hypothetical protein SOT80_03645 [Candidatus Pseudoruminococcus sp.]|uniref:hypothetical protein n=1 Tax=Candidatus Pseudoruminococcus sp. TaxID=3101048 RepID=UPI002A7D44C6|nr:NAD(P)H-dependent oxidoreductase [Ruminococcus sp.]MDY2782482.1 hypothetical protein [Candidatus Pseudoruminococcus sp.]